jgi:type II secretory pathway predicted ATPase ExeA
MKKLTNLKPVEKPDQWANGLDAFRRRHKLSIRTLAGFCSQGGQFVSKSAVERLVNGKAEPRFIERIRPAIRQAVRVYLENLNKSADEIDLELRTIFCKPEIEAMISERKELSLEAQRFFGLRRDPFDPLDPRSIDDLFTTPDLNKIAKHLIDAVRYQKFVAVIGPIGSGKTTLKKRVVEMARQAGNLQLFWPDFLNMDRVNSGSIVYWLLHQFEQKAPQDLISRAGRLKTVLGALSDDGKRVALGFDECHHLDRRMITALKNFWELGSGGFDRYLGVVLFGQPAFKLILSEHREIAERCEVIEMPALVKAPAHEYLTHRLALAGGKLSALFEPAAVSRILALANTPQALGNIANAGLLKACSFNEKRVLAAFIPEKKGEPEIRGIRPAARK